MAKQPDFMEQGTLLQYYTKKAGMYMIGHQFIILKLQGRELNLTGSVPKCITCLNHSSGKAQRITSIY